MTSLTLFFFFFLQLGINNCSSIQQLYNTFAEHGEITFARLCTDRETNRSRGFGFVSYKTKESADKAIEALNGFELEGRTIEVKEADGGGGGGERRERAPRDNNRTGGGGGGGECFAFKKGNCKYGASCRFSHENGGGSRPRTNDYEDAPRKQQRGGYEDNEGNGEESRRGDRKKKSTRE